MKKGILAIIIGIFFGFGVEASMVSFYVVETGLLYDGQNKSNQHSQRWEGAFLDVFFEAGHIVTNAPIQRLETKPTGDILKAIYFDMKEARDAGSDYVIIARLDYSPDTGCPAEVVFYVYKVTPQQKIYEKQVKGRTYGKSTDEVDDLKALARGLIPYIGE